MNSITLICKFANSHSELSPEGVVAIQKVAEELNAYPSEYSRVVSGHASSVGGKAFNKALSKRCAEAVAKVLVGSGIPAQIDQSAHSPLLSPWPVIPRSTALLLWMGLDEMASADRVVLKLCDCMKV